MDGLLFLLNDAGTALAQYKQRVAELTRELADLKAAQNGPVDD
jgi:hypothetical protein